MRFMRFEIEGLGKQFSAIVAERADEMGAAVKEAFDELAREGVIEGIIKERVRDRFAESVDAAMRSSEVHRAMASALASRLSDKPNAKTEAALDSMESLILALASRGVDLSKFVPEFEAAKRTLNEARPE